MTATADHRTGRSGGTPGGTPVAQALLDLLVEAKVRHVFCCPGSTEAAFLDAMVTRSDIELVLVTHESIAMAMAEGAARVSGDPAVAYLHTNVGMANAVAHLSDAQLARLPVVVLNGLKAATLPARDGFTTVPYPRDLVRQHVKWAWQSVSPATVLADVDRALRTAVAEPAGPTWVGLAQDVMEHRDPVPAPAGRPERFRAGVTRPDAGAVAEAAAVLSRAARPVLVAGSEVGRHRATGELVALAERAGAAVVCEKGFDFLRTSFPTSHPRFVGMYDTGHPAVRDADVLFFAGCHVVTEFDVTTAPDVPPQATVLHAHVDPTEIGRLYPADVGLVGHTGAVLSDLLGALPAEPRDAGWVEPLRDAWVRRPPPEGTRAYPGQAGLAEVIRPLVAGIDPDATVVLDATTATPLLVREVPQERPDQVLTSRCGSLGWGLGAALGAKLTRPELPVVAVLGDGVFQFGLQALWTAVHYQIDVTFVVLNNHSYSAVAAALHRFGGAAVERDTWPGTDIAGPDLAAIAAGFGVASQRVKGTDGLTEAVAAACRSGGPSLVEVLTVPGTG